MDLSRSNKQLHILLANTPYLAVGCIFAAQLFAFSGLITQHITFFAIEETLWMFAFLGITPLVFYAVRQKEKTAGYRLFLIVMMVWCIGYLSFQCFYALPFMYYSELLQDFGKVIPADALRAAIFDYTVTRDFHTWGGVGFIIWHSGYFSLCSWLALLYMSAPRFPRRTAVRTAEK